MNTATAVAAALAAGDTATAQSLRDAWTAREFGAYTDRELFDLMFYTDASIIEHDMHCCCDEECEVAPGRRLLRALSHEEDRRVRLGIEVRDDREPTLEERLAPFGIEWELEQRERLAA